MPHLNDQTEKKISLRNLEEFKQILSFFENNDESNSDTQLFLTKIPAVVEGINIDLISDPTSFIEKYLYALLCTAGSIIKQNGVLMSLYQKSVLVILKKIISIFAERTKDPKDLAFIKSYLSKKIPVLFKKNNSHSYAIRFSSSSNYQRTEFYKECVRFIIGQCINLVKLVWHLRIGELTNFVSFINQIQVEDLKREGISFAQGLYVQLQAFFKSGRHELLQFSLSQNLLSRLFDEIQNKVSHRDWNKNTYNLGLILIVQFFSSEDHQKKQKALQILSEIYLDDYFKKTGYSSQQLRRWIKEKKIYEAVTKDVSFFQKNIKNPLFKEIRKYSTPVQRVTLITNLLRENSQNQKIWRYFSEFDFYYIEQKQRQMVLACLKTLPNFRKIPCQFFKIVQELPCRDNQNLLQDIASFLFNVIQENYNFWQESLQTKSLSVIKSVYRRYLSGPFRSKSNQACNKQMKELMDSLLSKFDSISLELFVITIVKLEGWKSISHFVFKDYLMSLVDKYNLFQQIFSMAQKKNSSRSQQICREQLVKFIVEKIDFNDNIFKYIVNFTKSPQIFTSMIENTKCSTIQDFMKFLLKYYLDNPQTPFNIFKITFEKLNQNQFSSYNKIPGLLIPNQEVKRIQNHPKKLKNYQQMTQLLLQTNSKTLRREICKYIIDLYYNFSIKDRNSYSQVSGQESFIVFMKQIIDIFERDAQEYLSKGQLIDNGLLVNMQLITFATQFTDILGCGIYKPHKSLAATSTIVLHVVNNVTFGDDIEKNLSKDFPSSMILFDALAIMGLSFKCGPEDIVLKRNGQLISPIYNSSSLEDLNLNNQELVAEKNYSNPISPPSYYKFKNMKNLPQNIMNIIVDIFHRFAYQGKMGIIECTNFIRKSEESECISNDRRVKDVFEFDSDDDGILTLEDFINFYKKGLLNSYESDFTKKIKGFYNLRYRKNLCYYNEVMDISDQYYKMMRYFVCKSQKAYTYLFALSQDSNTQFASKAQQLLLLLPTPTNIEQYHLNPLQLEGKSQFQIYYILIETVAQLNAENIDIMEKKQKISGFLLNKNNETIFRLLEAYHLLPARTDQQNKLMLICLRILRSLINIDQLSKIDLRNFDSKQITFPSLPQTTFFKNQTLQAFKACDTINFETLLILQLSQNAIDIKQIIEFCFDNSTQIRKIACNFLYLWAIKTDFSFNIFDIPVKESDNQEWFQLLSCLIQQNKIFDLQKVRKNAINKLSSLSQTLYSRYNGLMNGYLKILIAFSVNNKDRKYNQGQYNKLFDHILNNTLSSINRSLVFTLIRNIEREYAYSYFYKMLSDTRPSQECLVRQKYMGIKNLGAICYINSILQQFFFIDKFKQLILQKNIPSDCKIVENKGQPVVDDFMYQLQKLYYYLEYSQKKYIVPNEFCFSFKNLEGLPINTTVQEDAHEFLNRLIEYSQESLKKEQKFKEFASILQIKKLNLIECQKCRNRIQKYENDYCLSVEVKGHETLEDSLKKFTQKQVIADYFCEKCQQKVKEISKSTYLNHLPQILIVNLQRIVYDPKRGEKVKVHSKMSFPFQMDFKEYVKNDNPSIDANYSLRGIVIHSGTSEAGHYYSLIKTAKDGWMKFNDQNVTSYNQNEIDRECFGGLEIKDGFSDITYSTNAYILFYQKKNKPVYQSFEIQNEFYTNIQKENLSLINELQIHQQSFFSAITDSYEDIRLKDIENMMIKMSFFEEKLSAKLQREYKELLHIGLKAFKFIGIYSVLKQETKWKIVRMIKELFFMLPAQTVDLKHINIQDLLQDMITKPSFSDRQLIKILLFQVISIKINYTGLVISEQGQLQQIIKLVLSYLQSTLFYLNIIKTQSYLLLLSLLMKRFQQIKIIFNRHHLFFKMLELIMGKESPFFKYHQNLVDLSFNIVPIVFDCILPLLETKTNLKGQKPLKQSHQLLTTFEAQILNNQTFFKRIQRLKYDHEAIGYIIQHFSTKDLDYSVLAAEYFITNLNKKESINNIPAFFNHLVKYLSIDDEFKTIRYGFIFGIPQNKEVESGQYCLENSDKSDYMSYISGVNYKYSRIDSPRQPLFQLACISAYHSNFFAISCLEVILRMSIENDHIFNYIMNLPPKTYYQLTYFDWVAEYLEKVSKDSHIIFDKKMEKMSELQNINEIISQKVDLVLKERKQPVQKYIIGKTKISQKIGAKKQEEFTVRYEKLTTYVLENKPDRTENKSMSSKEFYSFNLSGLGHVFVHHRSKFNIEAEAKDVKLANTLFRLVGETKVKLKLTYHRPQNPITLFIAEGSFTLTFPHIKTEQIQMRFFQVRMVKENPQKLNQIDISHVFPHIKAVKESEMKMQQQKSIQFVFEEDSMVAQAEAKIKCSHCTYDNNITSQICQMCQRNLFI